MTCEFNSSCFDGTYLRTAGVQGQVSVDGEGLGGVTVTLVGEGEDRTDVTDAGGLYAFSALKSGTYQVAITNPDPEDYEFTTTSKSATVATGETANVPFEGTLLRTAGIAGRVSLDDGMGLDGVTVTLAGAAEATAMTANGGQYSFAGLAAGTYVLSIDNPNPTAYNFAEDEMMKTVMLEDDQSAIVNFSGTHTRTASVSGILFIDEVMQDKMHNDGEPSIASAIGSLVAAGALDQEVVTALLAKAKVKLRGPDLNTETPIDINLDGTFSTGASLMAGSYQVELPVNDEAVAAGLAAIGVAFVGESAVVTVEAGGSATVNFPFRITMQTLVAGAAMGNAEATGDQVEGVELALYANADMTGMLGEATTDEKGMASFTFARDANTGPGGNDNIVFLKVKATGHDALAVSENDFTEVSYAGTDRVSNAPAAVKLVNVMANFQFWVKSDADARGGDMGLPGWNTEVYMGDPDADDAMPLMMVDEDGDTVNAVMPTDTAMATIGRAGLSYTVDPDDLPATFTVMVGETQAGAKGEKFEQSDALEHMHDGLTHPDDNTAEMNDLGPIYVTFTTQTLTVGVYREVDDEPGWTDYRAQMGGDKRPVAAVAAEMSAQLMTRDGRNRLRAYEYDDDGDDTTDPISSKAIGKDGMASFPNLPANEELTVRFHVGSDRMLVGETDIGDIEAFGQDLDIGVSYGSFGDEGGAMPEVKLCSLTTSRSPKENGCATFGYQWKTGSVSGEVAGPGGASVSLTAETDTHSEDRSTKTGADSKKAASYKQFSISDIQDGEYTLTTPNTAANSFLPKGGHDLIIYHDETEDDEDDDTDYVGTAFSEEYTFEATRLRLSIKGFVANDSNEDGRARGDDAMAGVTVNLLEAASDKDTAFAKVAATTETDGTGLYSFDNLTEGKEYKVAVPATDDYAGLRSLKVSKSDVVMPAEYPAKGVTQGQLLLSSWDHASNTISDATPTASADPPSKVSAVLQNFALVYKDNNVIGSVTDASGNSGGIVVTAAICRTYTEASDGPDGSPGGGDDIAEACTWETADVVTTTTAKGGDFEFNGLMEGYYDVGWEGRGYKPAKLDPSGDIDDDVTDAAADDDDATNGTRSPTSSIAVVKGQGLYSARQDFHVYNETAGTADILTSLKVEGIVASGDTTDFASTLDLTTIVQDDATGTSDLSGTVTGTVTWAAGGVSITTEQSRGASAKASLSTAVKDRSPTNLPFNKTGSDEAGTVIASSITVTFIFGWIVSHTITTLYVTRDIHVPSFHPSSRTGTQWVSEDLPGPPDARPDGSVPRAGSL